MDVQDAKLLEVDSQQDVGDPDAYVRAVMRWHFSEETGSPFWMSRRGSLGFDPIQDVRGVEDLSLFPNLIDEMRAVDVDDLRPRGLVGDSTRSTVFESGGTTGSPKRFLMFEEWFQKYLAWVGRVSASGLGGTGINLLATVPTGPHMIGEVTARQARFLGGHRFVIDLDPRWVKFLIQKGEYGQVKEYVDYLVGQTADILLTQNIGMIQTIPILLERIAERDDLVERVRSTVKRIAWGGAHLDADARHMLRNEIFPGIPIVGGYGSTTILSVAAERAEGGFEDLATFDTFSPYVFMRVVDPQTSADVPFGERGQVVMNHVTKYALIPNNLERDTGIRVPAKQGQIGCAVADVAPLDSFGGGAVTNGVY
ncbi:MAG TPA: AMP-binding protein [Kineosporiaceae bacterium]|nr:AMP-binding protein [Kineosporiaceae bacterium]